MDADSSRIEAVLDDVMDKPRREDRTGLTPAQQKELARRRGVAVSKAKTALTHLHPRDYRALYEGALQRLDEELGPVEDIDE